MRVTAILEVMWGAARPGQEAPRYFKVNPANLSGKRLYDLVGPNAKLVVTNACREYVTKATEHGKPDPAWLEENLRLIDGETARIDVLLVCGRVAQKTFKQSGYQPASARVIEIPHPAARYVWTAELLGQVTMQIQEGRTE